MIALDPELKPLLDELYKRMGRNLMFYQGIELTLKMILPFIPIKEGAVTGRSGKKDFTLGDLIRSYLDRLDVRPEFPVDDAIDVAEIFRTQIQKVVESRNRLAHTFYATPGVDNHTRAGLEAGLQLLNDDYREAETLYDDLVPLFIIYLEQLLARPDQPPEISVLHRLVMIYAAQRGLSVVVHPANYVDLVSLFKAAEASAPKIDGMTPLSWAGDFIRKSPRFRPEQLGEKKLAAFLIGTDMFEVRAVENESGTGHTVLYRSRPWSGQPEYHLFPVP